MLGVGFGVNWFGIRVNAVKFRAKGSGYEIEGARF